MASEPSRHEIAFTLHPRLIIRAMLVAVAVLVVFYLIGQYLFLVRGHDTALGFVPTFDMNAEGNIPALYSTLQLLFASFLSAAIAQASHDRREKFRWHWTGIALILLYMAVDESAQLHEKLIEPLREMFSTSGLLYFAWVIPYGLLVLIISLMYLRFAFAIRRRTALLFFAAGTLFVSGALGVELFEGAHVDRFGRENFGFVAFCAVEETLELVAIIVLVYALFDHMKTISDKVLIRVGADN